MNSIRVMIVDDHTMFLEALDSLLSKEEDIEVVGSAFDGNEAIQKVKKLKPDVMLIDIAMPNLDGLDAIQMIKTLSPQTSIIVLTMFNNENYIRQAFELGAIGYLLKMSPASELLRAIRMVSKGEYFLSSKISSTVILSYIRNHQSGGKVKTRYDLLSDREKQVFRLIIKGQNTKQIADILNISPKTVAKHRSNIMDKLDARDLLALVKFALVNGILDPNELSTIS